MKGAWWWNKEVKEKVNEQKEAYTAFINSAMIEEKEIGRVRYKAAKRVTKKAVAVANSMTYDIDMLYQNWRPKKGRRKF